jgi:hypothetical protein
MTRQDRIAFQTCSAGMLLLLCVLAMQGNSQLSGILTWSTACGALLQLVLVAASAGAAAVSAFKKRREGRWVGKARRAAAQEANGSVGDTGIVINDPSRMSARDRRRSVAR